MRIFVGAIIAYIVVVAVFGIACTDYFIWAVTGQDISFLGDLILAAFFSSFLIPAALLLWVGSLFGMVYPLVS